MPDLNYSNPWSDAAQAFGGVGNSLNHIALSAAAQQQRNNLLYQQMAIRAAQERDQAQLNQAHISYYNQQTSHLSQQGQELAAKTDAVLAGQRAMGQMGEATANLIGLDSMEKTYGDNPPMDISGRRTEALQSIARSAAQIPDKDRSHYFENVMQARQGFSNPTIANQIAIGNKEMYHNIPEGNVAVSVAGGAPQQGMIKLPPGNQLFPQRLDIPFGGTGVSANITEQPSAYSPVATNTFQKNLPTTPFSQIVSSLGGLVKGLRSPTTGDAPEPGSPEYDLYSTGINTLGQLIPNVPSALGITNAPTGGAMDIPMDATGKPDKAKMKKGVQYKTKYGPAIWDGERFTTR